MDNLQSKFDKIAMQFQAIACGHPEYVRHGNAWKVPAASEWCLKVNF